MGVGFGTDSRFWRREDVRSGMSIGFCSKIWQQESVSHSKDEY